MATMMHSAADAGGVTAYKCASAALFTSAKLNHLGLLAQGQAERYARAAAMVQRHDAEGFGSCSNEGECEAVCPKEIPITNIARMNRDYFRAMLISRE
jgi:succinate dehydrogenase / fumarate reductase iron-sulfur subunit